MVPSRSDDEEEEDRLLLSCLVGERIQDAKQNLMITLARFYLVVMKD
jgi:hypothetical protein